MKPINNGIDFDVARAEKRGTRHRMNRRSFLKISGVSAAVAAGGMLVYFSMAPTADQSTPEPTQPAPRKAACSAVTASVILTPEEAAHIRHLRHRRQHRDGIYDAAFDSWEECEHNCIGALYAHELG
jgi:hypothetical protein